DAWRRDGAIRAERLCLSVTLNRERLHERISLRVDAMLAAGLADEAHGLLQRYGADAPGLQSIGYAEWTVPGTTEAEIREEIIQHTRQYAKRQETWFRKRPGIPAEDLGQPHTAATLIKRVETFLDG
ncbi:MAG TPA: tRNA dimethylallyltransferase, partial [Candidatus Ozemobacteraceae bacterium]